MKIAADTDVFGFPPDKVAELEARARKWLQQTEEERLARPESWMALQNAIAKYCDAYEEPSPAQDQSYYSHSKRRWFKGEIRACADDFRLLLKKLPLFIEEIKARAALGEFVLRGRPESFDAAFVLIDPDSIRTRSISDHNQSCLMGHLPVASYRFFEEQVGDSSDAQVSEQVRDFFDVQVAERNKHDAIKPDARAGRRSIMKFILDERDKQLLKGEYLKRNREWAVALHAWALMNPRFELFDEIPKPPWIAVKLKIETDH